MTMIVSILFGALLYIVLQFLWYSPIVFGRVWLRLKQLTPERVIDQLTESGFSPKNLREIILPALLMSFAIHALWAVVGRFGNGTFFGVVGVLCLLTIAKKYLGWQSADTATRQLWYLGDGALFFSLLLLAVFVAFYEGKVY